MILMGSFQLEICYDFMIPYADSKTFTVIIPT